MTTTVEALIVSYNTKSELEATVRTLLEHPPKADIDLRVVVIDNASSDGSAEMIETTFPGVELIRSRENLGFGKANNLLAERSSADFLLLINSDVIVEQDIVTPLVAVLEARPEVIASGPRLRGLDGHIQHSAYRLPTLAYEFATVIRGKRIGRLLKPLFDSEAVVEATRELSLVEQDTSQDSEFLWATCWMVRRVDVQDGNLFDPSFPMYDEDLDFCRRAAAAGRKFAYVGGSELIHIGGASTASSLSKLRLMRSARRHYYEVHSGRGAAFVYATLVPAVAWLALQVQRVPKPGFIRGRAAL